MSRKLAGKRAKARGRMRVGMPAHLLLCEFGERLHEAFGEVPYLVGSVARGEREYHDVDIRLILDDKEYAAQGYGDPAAAGPHCNPKWVAMTLAWSFYGQHTTGLPIDFQIQQRTEANKDDGPRSALFTIKEWPKDAGGKP